MKKATLFSLLILVFLAGCANTSLTEVVSTAMPTATSEPEPTQTVTTSIQERVTLTPGTGGALTIEEHPLQAREDVEFVLAEYEDAEWSPLPSRPVSVEIGGEVISYREKVIPAVEEVENSLLLHVEVVIYINDESCMTIPVGTLKGGSIVFGIYTDGSSWYLEVDRGEAFYREDGTLELPILGDIYQDGVSLNEREGYDESFGFGIVNDHPFYFFVRNGDYFYHYNGNDYAMTYTQITHHMCCSGSLAEPRRLENGVVIFATQGDQRYLVLIGDV